MYRAMILLLGMSVLASAWSVSPCQGKPKRPAPPVLENLLGDDPVVGVGKTVADAKDDALEQARKRILEYLAEHYGEMDAQLTPTLLRQLNVVHQEGPPQELKLDRAGDSWEVKMTVDLTPEALSKIQKLARDHRALERQKWAAKGLAGSLAILLVVFGYLRLEEATKGYQTTWLRLAALAVLTSAGLLLWKLG